MTSRLEQFVAREREEQQAHAKRLEGLRKKREVDDQLRVQQAAEKGRERRDQETKARETFRHREG